jgi:hypothetical protein
MRQVGVSKSLTTSGQGRYELLGQCVVIVCAFVPFFAFKEPEGVAGRERLRGLF